MYMYNKAKLYICIVLCSPKIMEYCVIFHCIKLNAKQFSTPVFGRKPADL